MQKHHFLRFGFIAILLTVSLIVLHSFHPAADPKDSCCIKSCPKQPQQTREPGMIWESISRQFFSVVSFR